jgi:hypothetical protein
MRRVTVPDRPCPFSPRRAPTASPRPRAPRARRLLCAALPVLAITTLMPGCVEERIPRGPSPSLARPGFTDASLTGPGAGAGVPGAGGVVDPAAVLRPVGPGPTPSARVIFGIEPLGAVEYDGMTLPIIAPGGEDLAVQAGAPAEWPALLAVPGATSAATRIEVYDLRQRPITLAPWSAAARTPEGRSPIPVGALLGRSTDASGFLIEWPRGDGSRWIGRARWDSGQVEWLVRGQGVNAHAVLLADGALIFTRQAPGAVAPELVERRPDGVELVIAPARAIGASGSPRAEPAEPGDAAPAPALWSGWMLPSLSPDQTRLAAWRVVFGAPAIERAVPTAELVEFVRAAPPATPGEAAPSGEAATGWRPVGGAPLAQVRGAGLRAAVYQSQAAVEPAPVRVDAPAAPEASAMNAALLYLHPAAARLEVSFEPGARGRPLAEDAYAAARVVAPDRAGFAVATPSGVEFVPLSLARAPDQVNAAPALRPSTRLLDGPAALRQLASPDGRVLVVRPGGDRTLQLLRLTIAAERAQP